MSAQPAPASQPLPHQPQQLPAYGSDLERRAGCPEFPPVRAGKLDCPARFARPVRTARGGARRLGYLAWNPWEDVTWVTLEICQF
jgi:hypothetical protein